MNSINITVAPAKYSTASNRVWLNSKSKFFDAEYYLIKDKGDRVTIEKQSRLNIKKGSVKSHDGCNFYLRISSDIKPGDYIGELENDEKLIIYYQ